MLTSTIFYFVFALIAFIMGAIAYSIYPIFTTNAKNKEDAEAVNLAIQQYVVKHDPVIASKQEAEDVNLALAEYKAKHEELLTAHQELQEAYAITIATNYDMENELQTIHARKDQLNIKIEELNSTLTNRVANAANYLFEETEIVGYLYEADLFTVNSSSPKKLKEVKETGKPVILYLKKDTE